MIKLFSGDFKTALEAQQSINELVNSGFKYLVKEVSAFQLSGLSFNDTTPGKGVIKKDGLSVGKIALSDDPRCGVEVEEFSIVKTEDYSEYAYINDDNVWVNIISEEFISKINEGWSPLLNGPSYGYQVVKWVWDYSYYYTLESKTYGMFIHVRYSSNEKKQKSGWALIKYEEIDSPE